MVYTSKFQVPWGAVYKASEREVTVAGANGQTHRLLRVFPEEPGDLLFGRSTGPWKLISCTVSQTRYWGCSTAQFVVARPILSEADKNIDLDTISGLIGKPGPYYFDCRPEDPVVIELGYADAPFTDNPIASLSGRVFFGYVDTVKVTANSKGVKVVVTCRDPMRFLIDNKFSGSILSDGYRLTPTAAFDNVNGALSSQIARLDPLDVQKALTGYDNETFLTGGTFDPDLFITEGKGDDTKITAGQYDKHKIMAWIVYAGSNGACLPAPLSESDATFTDPIERKAQGIDNHIGSRNPRAEKAVFERSTRPMVSPEDAANVVQGMNVMNRFPLEVLKHLGAQEAEPRELYADIDTGRIAWRRKRTFNTEEGKRKVYAFLKPVNKGRVIPGVTNEMGLVLPNVIATEADWSTVGTVSEVVVINPMASAAGGAGANESSGVLNSIGRLPDDRYYPSLVPVVYPGLRRFVRKTRFIFDDTIRADDTHNAVGLIEAYLRIWGKDIRAGTFTAAGDAKLRPAHAVELHNFGIPKPPAAAAAVDTDEPFFRVEALTHKMTAAGPNKGYRTQVAWAEADETREGLMEMMYSVMGGGEFGRNDPTAIESGRSNFISTKHKNTRVLKNSATVGENDVLDGGQ